MSFKLFSAVSSDFQISSDSARKLNNKDEFVGERRRLTWKSFLPAFVSWTRAPDGGSGVERKGGERECVHGGGGGELKNMKEKEGGKDVSKVVWEEGGG